MNYNFEEGQIMLPQAWQDQTVNVLIPQDSPVPGANLVITRERLPLGTTPAQRIEQQRLMMAKELTGFKLILEQKVEHPDHVLHVIECVWQKDGKDIYQLIAVRPLAGEKLLCFTATVPGGHEASLRQRMVDAITSFKPK